MDHFTEWTFEGGLNDISEFITETYQSRSHREPNPLSIRRV